MAQRKVENLEAIITIDTPYTNFGKKVAVSSDAITIGQFAKLLRNNDIVIGRNRLFTLLRDRGYLIKKGKDKKLWLHRLPLNETENESVAVRL